MQLIPDFGKVDFEDACEGALLMRFHIAEFLYGYNSCLCINLLPHQVGDYP